MIIVFDSNFFHENYFIKGKIFDALKEAEIESEEIELRVPLIVYLEKRSHLIDELYKNFNIKKTFKTIKYSASRFDIKNDNEVLVLLSKISEQCDELIKLKIRDFEKRWDSFFKIDQHQISDYENSFENYFEGEGVFKDARKVKEHLPDSIISEYAKRLAVDEGEDVILLTKDERLKQSLERTNVIVCSSLPDLLKNQNIKNLLETYIVPKRIQKFVKENKGVIENKLKSYLTNKYMNTFVDCYVEDFQTNAYVTDLEIDNLDIDFDDSDSVLEGAMTLSFHAELSLEVDAEVSSYDAHMFGVQVSDVDESNWLSVSTTSLKKLEGQILLDLGEFKDVNENSISKEDMSNLLKDENFEFEIY